MKKNNLIIGLTYLLLGILILISTLFYTVKFQSIIFGLGFAFIASGLGRLLGIYIGQPVRILKNMRK
ncbi:MAG: hypothetical protein WAO56_10800 [Miniphocaeibacter sp.]|uniref:hypothetical protein n=1 Tax=Miniphocaeibacter sp. TaxID=3100973 RepID=UPI00185CFBFE|nr:hypothetical protein [Gallicola sp.]